MKTPEEIKRDLIDYMEDASCVTEYGDAHDLIDSVEKGHATMADALAYIQQLEKDNAQKDERIRKLEREKDDPGKELDKMRLSFAQQTARVAEHDCEMLKAVQKAISNLPRWISVEERLPDHEHEVLVYTDRYGGRTEFAYYVRHLEAWYQNCCLLIPNVTHWMPLPEPPEEDSE